MGVIDFSSGTVSKVHACLERILNFDSMIEERDFNAIGTLVVDTLHAQDCLIHEYSIMGDEGYIPSTVIMEFKDYMSSLQTLFGKLYGVV